VQYLLLMRFDEGAEGDPAGDCRVPGPGAEALAAWVRETEAQGVRLVTGARLDLEAEARSVRERGREPLVSDGPFAETKELVAGFQVIDCAGLEEAVAVASRHPGARSGSIEIRRIFEDEIDA
jgi:hypothetical protein